jgi:class 3 adenylate cyclase
MPHFMDYHDLEGVTPGELAKAHIQDVELQDKYGVNYITYWFDPADGRGFCLAEGPSAEAVDAVHRESHGLTASRIIQVDPGAVIAFMGALQQHALGEAYVASGFRAIMFTDLVGSTAVTQAIGDDASMALLRAHDRIVDGAVAEHGGHKVKHTGDGIMASFVSSYAAVQAAVAIQSGLADLRELSGTEVPVRIGISAGEPVTDDDDLFGAAVQLAARLSGHGTAGDVWVSRAVRDLCIGKTIRFSEAQAATLKGFAEPVEVFQVSWS